MCGFELSTFIFALGSTPEGMSHLLQMGGLNEPNGRAE
jgi:hypothetical protein